MSTEDKKTVENTEAPQFPFAVSVCFRGEGKPYTFGAYQNTYVKGDWVVVETAQGLEIGQVEADSLSISKYGLSMPTKGIVRKATETDHRNYERNLEDEKTAYRLCADEITALNLDMHLLNAQYSLDHDKILFIYIAEQRVDFRELLKKLGSILKCRIELRQIGERDKAKMVGGIGMCGMECCCTRFKKHFDVISINMAKNQLLALNIDKLSGMCGKLKCCLKYEDDDYKKLTEGLPKMGSQVEYEGEIYRVTNMNVMSEEAKLENRQTAIFISLDDLRNKTISRKGAVMKKREDGGRPTHKTVIHTNQVVEKKKEDRFLQAPTSTAEVRSFGRKEKPAQASNNRPKPANRDTQHNTNNRKPVNHHRRPEAKPVEEKKNVTVRTFGKKKKDSEDK